MKISSSHNNSNFCNNRGYVCESKNKTKVKHKKDLEYDGMEDNVHEILSKSSSPLPLYGVKSQDRSVLKIDGKDRFDDYVKIFRESPEKAQGIKELSLVLSEAFGSEEIDKFLELFGKLKRLKLSGSNFPNISIKKDLKEISCMCLDSKMEVKNVESLKIYKLRGQIVATGNVDGFECDSLYGVLAASNVGQIKIKDIFGKIEVAGNIQGLEVDSLSCEGFVRAKNIDKIKINYVLGKIEVSDEIARIEGDFLGIRGLLKAKKMGKLKMGSISGKVEVLDSIESLKSESIDLDGWVIAKRVNDIKLGPRIVMVEEEGLIKFIYKRNTIAHVIEVLVKQLKKIENAMYYGSWLGNTVISTSLSYVMGATEGQEELLKIMAKNKDAIYSIIKTLREKLDEKSEWMSSCFFDIFFGVINFDFNKISESDVEKIINFNANLMNMTSNHKVVLGEVIDKLFKHLNDPKLIRILWNDFEEVVKNAVHDEVNEIKENKIDLSELFKEHEVLFEKMISTVRKLLFVEVEPEMPRGVFSWWTKSKSLKKEDNGSEKEELLEVLSVRHKADFLIIMRMLKPIHLKIITKFFDHLGEKLSQEVGK